MGLERVLVDMVSHKFFLSHGVCLGKPLIYITKMVVHHSVDVILVFFMELGRSFLHGFFWIEHGRKLFVIDLDQFQSFLRCFLVQGDYSHHFITDIAHTLFGEHIFVIAGRRHSVGNIGNIFPGENQLDSLKLFRLTGINLFYQPVRNGRMQDFSVEHVLKIQISRVLGLSTDFRRGIHTRQAFPHGLEFIQVIGGRKRIFCLFVFFPIFDGFQDPGVPRAAAEVSGKSLFDFFVIRIRMVIDQRQSAHDHSGRAETALDGSMVDESPLQRMELAFFGDSFNCSDIRSLTGCSQNQAAVFWLSVNKHGARSAHSEVAPFFSPGQPQLLPENIQKGISVSNRNRMFFTVNLEDHDAFCSFRLLHDIYFFSLDFLRARANASDRLRRVKAWISSFLYQAEPRISEMGFPSSLAMAAASSKTSGVGFFVWRNSEALRASTGVGATAPRTMAAFSIFPFLRVSLEATEATAKALASLRVNLR